MKTNNTPLNHGRTGHPYFLHPDLPLNAFQSVRPRGEDKPSAVPARPHKGPEPTVFRGELLVHAGQTMTRPFYDATVAELSAAGLCPPDLPAFEDLPRGGLVGWTRVVDCLQEHPSPWKLEGSHGFVLRDSRPMPFVPWKGRLGFFNVPREAIPS